MDPLANFFIKITNAYTAGHQSVNLVVNRKNKPFLSLFEDLKILKPLKNNTFQLNKDISRLSIKKLSKPGRRIYFSTADIAKNLKKHGILIMSTSKGVMTAKDALKAKVGGLAVCKIEINFR